MCNEGYDESSRGTPLKKKSDKRRRLTVETSSGDNQSGINSDRNESSHDDNEASNGDESSDGRRNDCNGEHIFGGHTGVSSTPQTSRQTSHMHGPSKSRR